MVDSPDALGKVAYKALELMHFENVEAAVSAGDPNLLTEKDADVCVRGCYRCLLSYFNQMDHEQIDRSSPEVAQLLIDLARGKTSFERVVKAGSSTSPWLQVFAEAGLPDVDTMPTTFADNEFEFVWRAHCVAATSSTLSSEMSTAASVKGWEVVGLPTLATAGIPEQLTKLLKG